MKEGKIYFLRRQDGLVKIGYSAQFQGRLRVLTRSHGPLEVIRIINGDQHRENRLHLECVKHHQFGEWFRDSKELRDWISGLKDGTAVEVTAKRSQKDWMMGEAKLAQEATRSVQRMVELRRQRTGCKNETALSDISSDYGIGRHTLRRMYAGRALTVSAYTIEVLRQARFKELNLLKEQFVQERDAAKAGAA